MTRILFAAAEQEELLCAQHVCKLLKKKSATGLQTDTEAFFS